MTTPLPAVEVERARAELRETVDEITTVQHRRVEFDDGSVSHVTAPPLLTQVEQELTQQSAKAGSFTARSRPPLWLDAAQLLTDIDRETDAYRGPDRARRVRAWSAAMSSAHSGWVVDARDLARGWRSTVAALLDPKPKMRLRGQRCPSCGAEKVWDRRDEGADESHARPALEIDTDEGVCRCLCCEASWEPELWPHLTMVLQQQRHETLAVTGYDTTVSPRSASEAGLHWYDVGPDDLPTATDASRLRVHPDLIQCTGRIPIPDTALTRRCPSLLDPELACPNAARHATETDGADGDG